MTNISAKVTIVKARRAKAVSKELLSAKLKRQRLKAIADSYKVDDRCACVKSAGNGL